MTYGPSVEDDDGAIFAGLRLAPEAGKGEHGQMHAQHCVPCMNAGLSFTLHKRDPSRSYYARNSDARFARYLGCRLVRREHLIGGILLGQPRWLHSGRRWRRLQQAARLGSSVLCLARRERGTVMIGAGDLCRLAGCFRTVVCRRSGLGDVICGMFQMRRVLASWWREVVQRSAGAARAPASRAPSSEEGAASRGKELLSSSAGGDGQAIAPVRCKAGPECVETATQLATASAGTGTGIGCAVQLPPPGRATASAGGAARGRGGVGASIACGWLGWESPVSCVSFHRARPPSHWLPATPLGPAIMRPHPVLDRDCVRTATRRFFPSHIRFLGPNGCSLVLTTCRRVLLVSLYWLLRLGNNPTLFEHHFVPRYLATRIFSPGKAHHLDRSDIHS
ncbi:uncharacterized protein CC84DRAFT_1178872 [Paraphaeosphaeria sporulosa]|uniref:Uncharacterized protein n=1 Tax=Paraphaeosphaeria sporulosa TaxID=1460663 RepID=A0A177C3Z8_9PLEO|nr:uncharacterized protein CC84DRAFT_1178872 [Paraphaeosphaeria sporulosa]OAG01891.1 hypothetical protein CC84DRAFT_1178872 [Paraphaeosphaeria sporulosa]